MSLLVRMFGFAAMVFAALPLPAETLSETMFTNVRVFSNGVIMGPTSVLVRGRMIVTIGPAAAAPSATVIDGQGRTLKPGLIEAHTHLMFNSLPISALVTADIGYVNLVAGKVPRPC